MPEVIKNAIRPSNSQLMPIEIRLYEQSDYNFIKNSYMKSFRNSNLTRYVNPELYNEHQSRLFDSIVRTANILIACNSSDSYQILGYCIYDNSKKVLHYVYVKNPFRKNYIAKRLIERCCSENWEISHLTPFMKSMLFGSTPHSANSENFSKTLRKLKLTYNPYILFTYGA